MRVLHVYRHEHESVANESLGVESRGFDEYRLGRLEVHEGPGYHDRK